MKTLPLALVGLASLGIAAPSAEAQKPTPPVVQIPQSGVSQMMTLEGKFVRASYNNEGYVILGYQPAQRSVGEEWLLVEVGLTLRDGVKDFVLTRGAITLETPDGKTLPVPTIQEYRQGSTQALQNRAKVQRDSIDYFPPGANRACRMGFFTDLSDRAAAWDQFDVTSDRACAGRDQVRPALAQREVREESRARTLPHPDRGRGEDVLEELQEHQPAGQGRVQDEEELDHRPVHRVFVDGFSTVMAGSPEPPPLALADERAAAAGL